VIAISHLLTNMQRMWQFHTKGYLQAEAQACSIRVAYQAADESHPEWEVRSRRQQGSFADQSFHISLYRQKLP
jgi:ribosomal protein S7